MRLTVMAQVIVSSLITDLRAVILVIIGGGLTAAVPTT